jgi:outer membrane protein OmpA-like peptidoglycan-associated protein
MGWLVAFAIVLGGGGFGGRTIITSTSIEIYDPLVFAPGSDRLPLGADRTLAGIASTIDGNPSLVELAVEGQTVAADAPGSIARYLLGLRRANAVRARLIEMGVSPSRLVAEAGDGTQPAIAFIVLQRAP